MVEVPALVDALAGLGGVHIRVRHELPAASMRLMDSLGVVVEVDPNAPDCERYGSTRSSTPTRTRCRACARVDRELAALVKAADADSPVHEVGEAGSTLPAAARAAASTNAEVVA